MNEPIYKYKSVFAKDEYDIGTVNEYEARIALLVISRQILQQKALQVHCQR